VAAVAVLLFGSLGLSASECGVYLYSFDEEGFALTVEPGKGGTISHPKYKVCMLWTGYKTKRYFPDGRPCPWLAHVDAWP
jgi:hypothetical protein